MAELLLAPYLSIPGPKTVGRWRLEPIRHLEDLGELAPALLRTPAERLVDAYSHGSLGALVHLDGEQIGPGYEPEEMRRLGHALLAGALGANSDIAGDEVDGNAGWAMQTVENAALVAHHLDETGGYTVEIGALRRVRSMTGVREGEPLPKVTPPRELPEPMFVSFDDELGAAALACLGEENLNARRLDRGLDWFRIAFANSEAITADVRVGAARSALEAMTGAGDSTRGLVRSYGRLVDHERTARKTYEPEQVFWAKGPTLLTDEEWWMTRLCGLRNAIVHGDEITEDMWQHDGSHQVNQIHDRLLSALRAYLANVAGDNLLRLRCQDRGFSRARQRAEARTTS
jgi:hypothetical protein